MKGKVGKSAGLGNLETLIYFYSFTSILSGKAKLIKFVSVCESSVCGKVIVFYHFIKYSSATKTFNPLNPGYLSLA